MQIFYLSIFFGANICLAFFSEFWGIQSIKEYVFSGSLIAWISSFYIYLKPKEISISEKTRKYSAYGILFFYSLMFFCFLALPFRNLGYGDGVVLLENLILESELFGFQITLDEFLEAALHSIGYHLTGGDPELSYRIFSTMAGLIYLTISLYYIDKTKARFTESLIFLSPGVLLLFFGYMENYSLVAVYLFAILILGMKWIREKRGEKSVIWMAWLAGLGVFFHLVFGYLVFALVWFAWVQTPKEKRVPVFLQATVIGLTPILVLFLYFLFLGDPRINPGQTHLFSLPFYPISRAISLTHLVEFLSILFFSSAPGILILGFARLFFPKIWKDSMAKPENLFLGLGAIGFSIHAWIHNPQLGYPRDWDLFSFLAFPITILSFQIFRDLPASRKILVPLIIYGFGFTISFAKSNQNNPLDLEYSKKHSISIAREYVGERGEIYSELDPEKKKLFLLLDHFLFKVQKTIQDPYWVDTQIWEDERKAFLQELNLETNRAKGKYEKDWVKEYLNRITDFHVRFLKAQEEHRKYRLEIGTSL